MWSSPLSFLSLLLLASGFSLLAKAEDPGSCPELSSVISREFGDSPALRKRLDETVEHIRLHGMVPHPDTAKPGVVTRFNQARNDPEFQAKLREEYPDEWDIFQRRREIAVEYRARKGAERTAKLTIPYALKHKTMPRESVDPALAKSFQKYHTHPAFQAKLKQNPVVSEMYQRYLLPAPERAAYDTVMHIRERGGVPRSGSDHNLYVRVKLHVQDPAFQEKLAEFPEEQAIFELWWKSK